MFIKNLSILAGLIAIFACGSTKEVEATETTTQTEEITVTDTPQKEPVVNHQSPGGDTSLIWVNSYLGTLTNNGENQAGLLTQEGTKYPSLENWECIYPRINGFVFEPGYVCQLKVIPENIGGKPQLRMVGIVSKMVDMDYYRIHDIWALTHLNGVELKASDTRPNMEINLKIMKVMGKGTCNQYFGKITAYSQENISFGPIAGTKMMCTGIETETAYFDALSKTKSFVVKNLTLYFYDAEKNEILRFQKVD